MENKLSKDVYFDIKNFIFSCIDDFRGDAKEYGELQLTVACNADGTAWNFQTGDNSYTGGAYGLPHWAVVYIYEDSDPLEIYEDITSQLEELLF